MSPDARENFAHANEDYFAYRSAWFQTKIFQLFCINFMDSPSTILLFCLIV